MKFFERLKQLRKSRKLTQADLAKLLNVAQSTVGNWESGTREPDMEMITKISRALSVPVEQLFPYPVPADPTNIEPAVPPISMRQIPLVGNAAAGYTCLAEMQIVEYIPTDASLLHDGYEYVYLRVKGDSMEPELHEGDLVLVRVQDTIESGEYAVVLVDEEDGLVKKIELDRTHITLISENPYYPPRRFEREEMNRIRIFGKVISSVRRF